MTSLRRVLPRVDRLLCGGVRWRVESMGQDLTEVLSHAASPEGVPGARCTKQVALKELWWIPCEGAGVLVKRYRVRPSRAAAEFAAGRKLRELGLPVVAPFATARGLAVTRWQEGAQGLDAVLADPQTSPHRRGTLAAEFGRLVRRFHDAGAFLDDFDPNNVLVTEGDALLVVDLERIAIHRSLPRDDRVWNVAKVHRYAGPVSGADRYRFWKAYDGGDRDRTFAVEILDAHRRVLARDAAKREKDCLRENRNFARMGPSWFLRRREGHDEGLTAEEADRLLALCTAGGVDRDPDGFPVVVLAGATRRVFRVVAGTEDEARAAWQAAHALTRGGAPAMPIVLYRPAGRGRGEVLCEVRQGDRVLRRGEDVPGAAAETAGWAIGRLHRIGAAVEPNSDPMGMLARTGDGPRWRLGGARLGALPVPVRGEIPAGGWEDFRRWIDARSAWGAREAAAARRGYARALQLPGGGRDLPR